MCPEIPLFFVFFGTLFRPLAIELVRREWLLKTDFQGFRRRRVTYDPGSSSGGQTDRRGSHFVGVT